MAAVLQMTLSNAFSWMKMSEFRLRFHWSLFLRVQIAKIQHWFRYWLVTSQATSHYLNQWWLVYWRIYASLSLNDLNSNLIDFLCEGNSPITSEFPLRRASNACFDIFCNISLNKWLNKQLSGWWFEMSWPSCKVTVMKVVLIFCRLLNF